MSWTADRIETLRQGVADGLSYQEISEKLMGVFSRSACIGKAKRLGLGQTPAAAAFNRVYGSSLGVTWADAEARDDIMRRRQEKAERRALPKAPGNRTSPPTPKGPLSPLPPRAVPRDGAFDPTAAPILLVGRPFATCGWPVGEPERPADQLCCGARTGGKTYCPHHEAMGRNGFGRGVMGPERELLHAVRRCA